MSLQEEEEDRYHLQKKVVLSTYQNNLDGSAVSLDYCRASIRTKMSSLLLFSEESSDEKRINPNNCKVPF